MTDTPPVVFEESDKLKADYILSNALAITAFIAWHNVIKGFAERFYGTSSLKASILTAIIVTLIIFIIVYAARTVRAGFRSFKASRVNGPQRYSFGRQYVYY